MNTATARLNLVLWGFCLFFLSACSQVSSNSVDPSTIYGNISIDREGNNINVSDTFYVGGGTGTIVTIDSPAEVLINGSPAQSSTDIINSTSYDLTLSTGIPSIDVNYIDKNGRGYDNDIGVPGDIWNTNLSGIISMSAGFSVTVNSHDVFLPGEGLEVTLDSESGGSLVYNTDLNVGATVQTVSVSANQFQYFSPGTARLTTCRTMALGAQNAYPKGTEIDVQSCSTASGATVTF